MHVDLYTANQEGEVERLIELGATRYPWRYRPQADFVVLEDPDGHLFCVVPGPRKAPAVKRTIEGAIATECPATILRRHPDCTLYLDRDSAGA